MKVVVISSHLDDAVWSIGATLRAVANRGAEIRVVTVFAGDPGRDTAPSYWDGERGVATAAEATALRRQEDVAASKIIGYEPVWLPFDDSGYVYHRDPEAMATAVEPHLADASVVLIPGWPLEHMDHRYAAMMMIERVTDQPLVLYSELPYAVTPRNYVVGRLRGRTIAPLRSAIGGEVAWSTNATSRADRAIKRAGIACYRGEVTALGYRARMSAVYERIVAREVFGFSGVLPGGDAPDWTEILATGAQGLPSRRQAGV